MLKFDNIKAIKEVLKQCCVENETDGCMQNGCNICEAEYLDEHGVVVKLFGHWIESRTEYICSVCAGKVKDEIVYMIEPEELPNYCPNCGAKMKGENND